MEYFSFVKRTKKKRLFGFIFCVHLSVYASSPSLFGLVWPVCLSLAASCPFPSSSERRHEPVPAFASVCRVLLPRWCS